MAKRNPGTTDSETIHLALDIGSSATKGACDTETRPIKNATFQRDPSEEGAHLFIMDSAYAIEKSELKRAMFADDPNYNPERFGAAALKKVRPSGKERYIVTDTYEGGYIIANGRITTQTGFNAVLEHFLDVFPKGSVRAILAIPPEEYLHQQERGEKKQKQTKSRKIMEEFKHSALESYLEAVPQNTAAGYMIPDNAVRYDDERAIIIDIGDGTTDIQAINIVPDDPRHFEEVFWIKVTESEDGTGENVAGNYRDMKAQDFLKATLKEKYRIDTDIAFMTARGIMAKFAHTDPDNPPEGLEKYSWPLKGGKSQIIDIREPVYQASLELASRIPQSITDLTDRFVADHEIVEQMRSHIYVTGRGSAIIGLPQYLQTKLKDITGENMVVKSLEDPTYSVSRGALRIGRAMTRAKTKEKQWTPISN